MPVLRKKAPAPPSQSQADEAMPMNFIEDLGGGPTQEQIAERAYELFLARGGEPGSALEDWYRAERELRASDGQSHFRQ